jgi:hypothetical protein
MTRFVQEAPHPVRKIRVRDELPRPEQLLSERRRWLSFGREWCHEEAEGEGEG